MRPAAENDSDSDEIRREDGLERSWMFYNGEWAETICGLIAGMSFIFWCFLYVLGYGQSTLGYILLVIAIVGFIGWRFLFASYSEYQRSGWRKGKGRSPLRERREAYLAVSLWLFIFISVGIILFLQWRHPH
jgi:hypothetical protein